MARGEFISSLLEMAQQALLNLSAKPKKLMLPAQDESLVVFALEYAGLCLEQSQEIRFMNIRLPVETVI